MNGVAVRDVPHLDLHRLRLRRRVIALRALAGPVLGPDEAEDVRPQLVGGEDLQAFPAEGSISLFLSYFKRSVTNRIRIFFARPCPYLHTREHHEVEAGDQGEEGVEHPAGQAQLVKACRKCGKYCDQNTAQPTPIYTIGWKEFHHGKYRLRWGSISSYQV